MANNQAKTIAKRLYGSNFTPEVRQTLKERQLLAKEPQPGDSLTQTKDFQTYASSDGKKLGIGGMSAQTPFIRMWTAIDIYRKTITDHTFDLNVDTIKDGKKIEQYGIEGVCGEREKHGEPSDSYCQIEFGKVYHIERIGRQYHELGNHTLYEMFPESNRSTSTADGKKNNDFLKPAAGIISANSSTEGSMGIIKKTEVSFRVHNFKDYNDIYSKYFLKPGAVVFVDFGWNKLAPVNDESWTKAGLPEYTLGQLYQPKHVIEYENSAGFLYGEHVSATPHMGWIDYQKGNVETVYGYVTNYNSKQNPDGSFDCSITVTSGTSALNRSVDKNMNSWMSSKIDGILENYMLNAGMKLPEGLLDEMTGMKMNQNYEGMDTDSEYEVTSEDKKKPVAREEVDRYFNQVITSKQSAFLPKKFNVQTGITAVEDNIYISLDLFEELILNPLYSESQISRNGEGSIESAPKFNSTFGMMKWSSLLLERQLMIGREYGADYAANMPILHPTCITDPPLNAQSPKTDSTSRADNIYYNSSEYLNAFGENKKVDLIKSFPTAFQTPIDYVMMPDFTSTSGDSGTDCVIHPLAVEGDWYGFYNSWIGDLFISVDVIKRAFSQTDSHDGGLGIMTVVKNLLKDINERTGYMNLEMVRVNSTGDGQVMITDTNCITGIEEIPYIELATDDKYDSWDDMFVFDVTSGNSIVSNLDINFSMPSDNISNMIAIGSGGTGRGFSPMNRLEDEAIATELATSGLDIDETGKIVDFFTDFKGMVKPNPDEVLLRKIARDNFNSHMDRVFELSVTDVYERKGMNHFTPVTKYDIEAYIKTNTTGYDMEKLSEPGAYMDSLNKTDTIEQNPTNKIKENDKAVYFEKEGTNQTSDIATWYNRRIKNELYATFINTVMPFKLGMTIHGLANIDFGNIFRVNLLPKSYIDTTYFQIMKVSHTVDQNGWNTSLDTQFRMRSKSKKDSSKVDKYKQTYLSSDWVRNKVTNPACHNRFPWHAMYKVKPLTDLMIFFSGKDNPGSLAEAWGGETVDWTDQDSVNNWREKWFDKTYKYVSVTDDSPSGLPHLFEFECRFDHDDGDIVNGYLTKNNIVGQYGTTVRTEFYPGMQRYETKAVEGSDTLLYIDPYTVLQVFEASQVYTVSTLSAIFDGEGGIHSSTVLSDTNVESDTGMEALINDFSTRFIFGEQQESYFSFGGWSTQDIFDSISKEWEYAGGMFSTRFTEEKGVNVNAWGGVVSTNTADWNGNSYDYNYLSSQQANGPSFDDIFQRPELDFKYEVQDNLDSSDHYRLDYKIVNDDVETKRNSFSGYIGFVPYVPHKKKMIGFIQSGVFIFWEKEWWDKLMGTAGPDSNGFQSAYKFLLFCKLFCSKTPSDKVSDTFGETYNHSIFFDMKLTPYSPLDENGDFAMDDVGNLFDNGANLFNASKVNNANWLSGEKVEPTQQVSCNIEDGYYDNPSCEDDERCWCDVLGDANIDGCICFPKI